MEMEVTFKNQLNKREIRSGVFLYVNRQRWPFVLMVSLLMAVIASLLGQGLLGVLIGFIAGAILAEAVSVMMLQRSFSPDKVATYRLNDKFVEIVNDDASKNCFPWEEIGIRENSQIYLLVFKQLQFAIIAKRNLDEESNSFLKSVIKK